MARKPTTASIPVSSRRWNSASKLVTTDVVDAEPAPVERNGALIVTGGIETGRVLALDTEVVTLGRSSECTYAFNDASLSREHARMTSIAGRYLFQDADSTNGSFLNDARVTTAELKDGDHLRLGLSTSLRFAMLDEAEESALRRVYEAAIRDGLTGVFNRKHFEERMAQDLVFALRHHIELSVIMIDIDHFKQVNDAHGHPAGDAVLKTISALLAAHIRKRNVLARYGGEEFVILCRNLDGAAAVDLAETLRRAIEAAVIPAGAQTLSVTCSAGVASLKCCGTEPDMATLIGKADERLYLAKQSGRNRVVGPAHVSA